MIRESGHAEEKMREAGLRVTPQRRAVWGAFGDGKDGHLAADEVFARARRGLPELSRPSTTRSRRSWRPAYSRPSRAGTPCSTTPTPTHQHFRCRNCDRLYDVRVEGIVALRIPGEEGFVVESKTVLLRGLCPACSATGEEPDAAGSGV